MSLSREEVLDAIAEMSVMDVVQLVEAMEEKFGVSAAAAVAAAPVAAAGGDAAPAEEKDEFDIVLDRCRRQESQRHQGSPGHYRPWTQRSQRNG